MSMVRKGRKPVYAGRPAGACRRETIAWSHSYVPKTFSAAEIVKALQVVMDGLIFVPSLIAHASHLGSPGLSPATRQEPGLSYDEMRLTKRQREVLELIVRGEIQQGDRALA